MTRRKWVEIALAAGAFSMGAAGTGAAVYGLSRLLPPPVRTTGTIIDGLV